jgi:hypothetical protein
VISVACNLYKGFELCGGSECECSCRSEVKYMTSSITIYFLEEIYALDVLTGKKFFGNKPKLSSK